MLCDGDTKSWEEALLSFRRTQKKDIMEMDYCKADIPEILSLEQQFGLITSIPNFHKWPWNTLKKKIEIKFEQRLSTCCRYFPGSPRNRILQVTLFSPQVVIFCDICDFCLGIFIFKTFKIKKCYGSILQIK